MLFRQIEYFQAVVETSSFYEAAERCHVSQSAISQQVRKLAVFVQQRYICCPVYPDAGNASLLSDLAHNSFLGSFSGFDVPACIFPRTCSDIIAFAALNKEEAVQLLIVNDAFHDYFCRHFNLLSDLLFCFRRSNVLNARLRKLFTPLFLLILRKDRYRSAADYLRSYSALCCSESS